MKKKIFHIDDDIDQTKLISALLSNEYDYHGFQDCQSLLSEIKTNLPDLCIIDLNLDEGKLAGIQLIRAINKHYEEKIPLLVLSKVDRMPEITYALELGVLDYIVKPIDPHLIKEKINRYFENTTTLNFPLKILRKKFEGTIDYKLTPYKIDSMYLYCKSSHYITKNSIIEIDANIIKDIFQKLSMNFEVFDCDFSEEDNQYVLVLQGKALDDHYYNSIQEFLTKYKV